MMQATSNFLTAEGFTGARMLSKTIKIYLLTYLSVLQCPGPCKWYGHRRREIDSMQLLKSIEVINGSVCSKKTQSFNIRGNRL